MTVAEQEAADESVVAEADATKEAEAKAAAEVALNQFTEGFTGEPVKPVEPTEEDIKAAEEVAKAEADRVAAEEAAKAVKAAEPKLAQLTEPQLLDLVQKANSVTEIRAIVDKVRDETKGRVGSLEQTIKKLQEATPVGQAIVVTAEDFAEIGKDLPEHAKMLADGLTRVLSKFKGTAPVKEETPEEFEARVNRIADERFAQAKAADIEREKTQSRTRLSEQHADYATVIGSPESNTPWRQWLKTQPGSYETRMLSTWDADVLADSLDRFKEFQKEQAKKPKPAVVPNGRAQRLAEAVPARGGASAPRKPGVKTPEEELAEGFNS